jgi:hypothetical protein
MEVTFGIPSLLLLGLMVLRRMRLFGLLVAFATVTSEVERFLTVDGSF